ncbi:MAG: L,D-transpeptidase family protein, partial [Rhodospirillales bacterium]|nr:L,D-transpeptidase family protein [Acetobacter sp.]
QKFYEDRDWELAWTRDGKPTRTATEMIQLFTDADKKGLRPDDYDGQRWQEHLHNVLAAPKDENAVAQFDVALSVAAVRYLNDLHLGRINPQSLNFDINVPAKRASFDVATLLNEQIVDESDIASVADGLEPQNPLFKATEHALPHYLELAEKVSAQPQPELPTVEKPVAAGGNYPAMEPLVQRLALEGDGTPQLNGNQYTPEVAQAVQHFQTRMGLNADGKLSAQTLEQLNVPMSVRVQQIDDALEKWRWLPEDYAKPRLLVNLPEFLVRAYTADGNLDFKMRVVDGEAKGNHDTPVFVRTMKYLIFRPYWNLPVSIVKKELLRHLGGGNGYLEAHGYEVINSSAQPVSNWSAADLEHSRFLVRQKPGPKNSLGLVKFMFPNEYDIYMHSTPEMNLFNLARRDRSHGCIRLNDAEKMANWVLQGQSEWDADKIHQAMYGEPLQGENAESNAAAQQPASSDVESGVSSTSGQVKDNKQVNLKTQLPVVITYLTANADEDGTMHFFNDVYGYDKELETALAKPRPFSRSPVKINPKLTPGETE